MHLFTDRVVESNSRVINDHQCEERQLFRFCFCFFRQLVNLVLHILPLLVQHLHFFLALTFSQRTEKSATIHYFFNGLLLFLKSACAKTHTVLVASPL